MYLYSYESAIQIFCALVFPLTIKMGEMSEKCDDDDMPYVEGAYHRNNTLMFKHILKAY